MSYCVSGLTLPPELAGCLVCGVVVLIGWLGVVWLLVTVLRALV